MRRTSPKIDRSEVYALPKALPIGEAVGLDDASIATLRGTSILSKLQATIRKDLRKATGAAIAVDILRQFAIPWPMSTDILLRLTAMLHPAIRHPSKPESSFLSVAVDSIVDPFRPAGRNLGIVARYTPSDPRVFNVFGQRIVAAASQVTGVSLIKQDPPGAKRSPSEHDSVFEWKWWRTDAYTWMAKQSFGAKSYPAAQPMLPPDDAEPLNAFSPGVQPLADSLADAWGLEPHARRHLLPRLFRDHDIELLCDSLGTAPKASHHEGLFGP